MVVRQDMMKYSTNPGHNGMVDRTVMMLVDISHRTPHTQGKMEVVIQDVRTKRYMEETSSTARTMVLLGSNPQTKRSTHNP